MKILPGSYVEWGLCIFTVWFCWWKYGWNIDVIKGMRQLFKKIEDVLLTVDTKNKKRNETAEMKHYRRLPITGTPFTPRPKGTGLKPTKRKRSFGAILDEFVKGKTRTSKPFQGPCSVCDCRTKDHLAQEIRKSVPLKNCLDFASTRAKTNPWYIRLFSDFIFWWRKWHVGFEYNVVTLNQMMEDQKVRWAISEAAVQEYREKGNKMPLDYLVDKYYQRVERIVRRMRAKQPAPAWYSVYTRIAPWVIAKFLSQIYPQVLVRNSQVDLIRKARESGFPILYLPVHKSHIDYVLVSWTLVCCDMRSPIVAAGDNLDIPVFNLMMKSVGGFFIKRKFETKSGKKDTVYRTMLQSYMRRTFTNNNDMEFFIEGGRTRTGKPCMPKGGLLSIVLDTLLKNKVQDILVIPVNFSYDRVLEGNYIREQLGQPKVNESFANAFVALFSSLQPKYGNARVDYGHPFSMKDFVRKHEEMDKAPTPELSSSGCSSDTDSVAERAGVGNLSSDVNHRKLVEALGRHAIYEGIKCYTMTSTNAISFLLLNKFRNGVDFNILKTEVLQLKEEMMERGHDSAFTKEDVETAIRHGIKVLGPSLVRIESRNNNELVVPMTDLPNVIELSYYSNCILPIYAQEAIVASSVFKLLGDFCNNSFENHERIKESELIATCLEYSDVLHNEFLLCPPCQTLASSIQNSILYLSNQGIFSVSVNEDGERLLEIRSSDTLSRLVYLKNLLRPILDVYTTASQVLRCLVGFEAEEKKLHMNMLAEIKKQLLNKAILYGESLALDPIRNFVQRVVHWQVLECHKKDLKATYNLHDDFNSLEAVEELIQRLGKLRV